MAKELFLAVLFLLSIEAEAKSTKNEAGCFQPTVSVTLDKGKPKYISKSYKELVSLCRNTSVLGCTISRYACAHKVRLNGEGCKQLDFNCYPVDFNVYINNEYPVDSCEYKAIKKHENFHVDAIQNFSTKNVDKYITKCIDEEMKKKKLKTGEEIYRRCANRTIVWMNRKKEEKNDEIDAYKKYHPFYFSKCTGWKTNAYSIEATLDALVD